MLLNILQKLFCLLNIQTRKGREQHTPVVLIQNSFDKSLQIKDLVSQQVYSKHDMKFRPEVLVFRRTQCHKTENDMRILASDVKPQKKKKKYAPLYSLAETFSKTADSLRYSYHCQPHFLLLWAWKQKTFTRWITQLHKTLAFEPLYRKNVSVKKSRDQV